MMKITQLATHKSEFRSLNSLHKLTPFLIPVLVATLLLSCSAAQHAGIVTVSEPPFSEDNESRWFSYYEDQFDAKEGNVEAPPAKYPAARHAYIRAKEEWDAKVQKATTKTAVVCLCGMGVFLIVYAGAIIVSHSLSHTGASLGNF